MAKKRTNWSAASAEAELAAWKDSGLAMREFCRRRGIGVKRLSWWRRRLAARGQEASQLQFIEAAITGGTALGTEPALAIVAGRDVRVEIAAPERVDASWLATLITNLAGGH